MSGTELSMAGGGGRPSLTATTVAMVAGVIASFFLFVLVFFLYLRAKRYWGAIPVSARGRAGLAEQAAAAQRHGLDAAAIAALPSVVFQPGDCKERAECAVCLYEFSKSEAARLLPKCGHAFHLECIDTWFSCHSTCPLCRSLVVVDNPEGADSGAGLALGDARSEDSSPDMPPNSLIFGDLGVSQAASLSSSESSSGSPPGVLVIETARRAADGIQTPSSPLPASVLPEEVRWPPAATLRPLRRLLIRGRMIGAVAASCSPRGGDFEQGCLAVSKLPTSS